MTHQNFFGKNRIRYVYDDDRTYYSMLIIDFPHFKKNKRVFRHNHMFLDQDHMFSGKIVYLKFQRPFILLYNRSQSLIINLALIDVSIVANGIALL